jgi:hypothetical protein
VLQLHFPHRKLRPLSSYRRTAAAAKKHATERQTEDIVLGLGFHTPTMEGMQTQLQLLNELLAGGNAQRSRRVSNSGNLPLLVMYRPFSDLWLLVVA